MYLICKHMGWDYWTYRSQPQSFVNLIFSHMNTEGAVSGEESRKSGSDMSSGMQEVPLP